MITDITPEVSYNCNGVLTDFDFTFPIQVETDLLVYKVLIATGVETLQTQGVDYNLAATNEDYTNGGTVTTVGDPWEDTYKIRLLRSVPFTQALDLVENQAVPAATLEATLDKITMILQDLKNTINNL